MKKLVCTMCILSFFDSFRDFCTLSDLKYAEARMQNVHPGLSSLHLSDRSSSSELKEEEASTHKLHPSFFFHLQLFHVRAEG